MKLDDVYDISRVVAQKDVEMTGTNFKNIVNVSYKLINNKWLFKNKLEIRIWHLCLELNQLNKVLTMLL